MHDMLSEFKVRYPEFVESDENVITFFMGDATAEISQRHWGRHYRRGVLALTAHFFKLHLMQKETTGEPLRWVISETAGSLSVSYETMGQTDPMLSLTAYGQEYLRLRRMVGVGVMVV